MLKTVCPDVKILLGGPEVSYDSHHWLRRIPEVDFIVMGEGETSFKQLLRYLHGEILLEDVLEFAIWRMEKLRFTLNHLR